MDLVQLFAKDGPSWLFSGCLLIILVAFVRYMITTLVRVIENNTRAVASFTEIVQHCKRKGDI